MTDPLTRGPVLTVTGHRPPGIWQGAPDPYAQHRALDLERFAVATIRSLPRPRGLLIGMALGWDQACAGAAIILGLPWVAAVPFTGQDTRWPPHAREHYRWLLSHATDVRVISPGQYTPEVMHARNRWMVDRADAILAFINPGATSGGTRACLTYAESLDRPIAIHRVTSDDLTTFMETAR